MLFDVSSLFTSVQLDETIEICADALYRDHLHCPPFPEDTFRELIIIATREVEFSFNNQIYKQLVGMAIGSPLGPALANIFVGFREVDFLTAPRNQESAFDMWTTVLSSLVPS